MKKYKVISMKFGSTKDTIARMEEAFNDLGLNGWQYKG